MSRRYCYFKTLWRMNRNQVYQYGKLRRQVLVLLNILTALNTLKRLYVFSEVLLNYHYKSFYKNQERIFGWPISWKHWMTMTDWQQRFSFHSNSIHYRFLIVKASGRCRSMRICASCCGLLSSLKISMFTTTTAISSLSTNPTVRFGAFYWIFLLMA